jgi:hypothetical protein
MAAVARVTACLAAAALLLAGVGSLRSAWVQGLGLDVDELQAILHLLEDQHRHSEELDAKNRFASIRLQLKTELARDLAHGKRTLPEAAACVRQLCDADPETWVRLRREEAGDSDPERLCRHIIGWARWELSDDPARAEEVGRRLDDELRRLLDAGGAIHLPQVNYPIPEV